MPRFKLEIVRPECTGCELCTTTCPDLFEMGDDGFSSLKGGQREGDNDVLELADEGCARQAAEDCPAACIHLYEGGTKIV
ncbi:MAG: ferredoxin [Thermoplasmata archaeon]